MRLLYLLLVILSLGSTTTAAEKKSYYDQAVEISGGNDTQKHPVCTVLENTWDRKGNGKITISYSLNTKKEVVAMQYHETSCQDYNLLTRIQAGNEVTFQLRRPLDPTFIPPTPLAYLDVQTVRSTIPKG